MRCVWLLCPSMWPYKWDTVAISKHTKCIYTHTHNAHTRKLYEKGYNLYSLAIANRASIYVLLLVIFTFRFNLVIQEIDGERERGRERERKNFDKMWKRETSTKNLLSENPQFAQLLIYYLTLGWSYFSLFSTFPSIVRFCSWAKGSRIARI